MPGSLAPKAWVFGPQDVGGQSQGDDEEGLTWLSTSGASFSWATSGWHIGVVCASGSSNPAALQTAEAHPLP